MSPRTPHTSADRTPTPWRWAILGVLLAVAAGLAGCGRMAARGLNAEGVRLYDQGQYQLALERFQRAAGRDPQSADAYYNLASTYHRMGSASRQQALLAQAEHYYHRSLDKNANHQDSYRGLAVLLVEEERSPAAFRLLHNWVNQSPGMAEPKYELARLYDEFGDRQAAKGYLLEALAIDHTNPRVLTALGYLREQMGEPRQALENYKRSLQYNNSQPEVAMRVASLQAALQPGSFGPTNPNAPRMVEGGTLPLR